MQTEPILQKMAGTVLKIPFLRFQSLSKEVVSALGSEHKRIHCSIIADSMINLAHKHSDSIKSIYMHKKMVLKWSKNVNQA
jgi:hypothetical protein